ncbi:MAG: transporter ATP-binding protein [Marmoricola sp.]|nr:transporter ATP-binding protein [Marmoricola sp.]
MMQAAKLQAHSITKRYGAVHALGDVDFQIAEGEVVALLGENGAGKSTFVKVLSGLVHPDAGSISIDGMPADISSSAKSQAARIAVVQQEYSTIGTLSVAENLMLGRSKTPFFWGRKWLRSEAERVLKEVGLQGIDPSTKVSELSVAEMQLLEIAKVLAADARIIIFDEPTAALSEAEAQRVLETVRRLAAKKISIIYVTHRLPEVFQIADSVVVFRNGRSLGSVPVQEIDVKGIIAMMLGRDMDSMFPDRSGNLGQERLRLEDVEIEGLRSPVSLVARSGEILGLTGQLGSGADAVVKALASERGVLGGRITIDGTEFVAKNRMEGLRSGIAYCTADRKRNGIFPGLSIYKNMSSSWLDRVTKYGFISSKQEKAAAQEYAASFAIDRARLSSNVGQLSGGNQQKVVLSKWLGNEPTVYLVEEPTRGVDVGARSDIYTKLRALCAEGMTVVVASSDTAEIMGLCDSIATFYHGEMIQCRPASDWHEDELVAVVMNRSE